MHEVEMTRAFRTNVSTTRASFITLTYSDANLPPNGQLSKRDWQLFAKRLRHHIGEFRYLMCGEYGPNFTERAHLHAIILGEDFGHDRTPYKKSPSGHHLFISPTLDAAWQNGLHSIGDVSFDSVAYCAGYISKKVNGDDAKDHYRRVNKSTGEIFDQVPEFGLMSRNKGLGTKWIEKFYPEVYPRDEVFVNDHLAPPPAFYDRWYGTHFPEQMEDLKELRKTKALKYADNNTPDRLATREVVFKSKYANYLRLKGH